MCGIAGIWSTKGPVQEEILSSMAARLHHRGPDSSGIWADASASIGLAHTRLSIIDLSALAAQPMTSACGRYVISFNGEIYNFRDLRKALTSAGTSFRGGGDTEVLLAMISRHGLSHSLKQLNGMFAFALWDRLERRLTLARDRFGEKPVYYAWTSVGFLFASELKGFRAIGGLSWNIAREALLNYFALGYIAAPHSIYQGVFKLPPASILQVSAPDKRVDPTQYWTLEQPQRESESVRILADPEIAVEELEALLTDAVRMRMASDVPLGAFLSGGVDSSTIVTLMQALSSRPVRTFSIGVETKSLDESQYAREVASHLGTSHTEFRATAKEAMAVIPDLPSIYDEPFSDSSQIPTLLVSELARKSVTVSLSGDGADELFGGYSRYQTAPALWRLFSWAPISLRRGAGNLFGHLADYSERMRKASEILSAESFPALHQRLLCSWHKPSDAVSLGWGESRLIKRATIAPRVGILEHRSLEMMQRDSTCYLPDDILTKVDRASMSVGLEVRAPFLDVRLAEFAWRLPWNWKAHPREGKWILRKVLERHVPRNIFSRPKMGFGVPVGEWLRGPLREWAECLLDERRLRTEGYLRPEPIRTLWRNHLAGRRDAHIPLWTTLMFQAWNERWR